MDPRLSSFVQGLIGIGFLTFLFDMPTAEVEAIVDVEIELLVF